MESRKSRFEDHLNTIEAGYSKTAASRQKSDSGNNLLAKLAQELGLGDDKNEAAKATASGAPVAGAGSGETVTDPKAPAAEGEVIPAASGVTGASDAVSDATDAVAMPQVSLAGGVPAVMEAGSAPNPEVVVMPVISAADGVAQTATDLHRTAEAVVAAAEGGDAQEATKIGKLIAKAFQDELQKSAKDQEYTEALEILKEAGLLEGYSIKNPGLEKTASSEGYLEKIASMQKLSKDDIIGAARELVEFNKQAADAEEQGREAARNLVELFQKVAEESKEKDEEDKEGDEEDGEKGKEGEEGEEGEKEAHLKIASLLSDPKVVEAVKTLKAKNLL